MVHIIIARYPQDTSVMHHAVRADSQVMPDDTNSKHVTYIIISEMPPVHFTHYGIKTLEQFMCSSTHAASWSIMHGSTQTLQDT